MSDTREVWQRGPVERVPASLQPVAHALLQAVEEAERYMADFPSELLWKNPADVATPGFHVLHMCGVIDRLFTYARGEVLSSEQLKYLSAEKEIPAEKVLPADLVRVFRRHVENAIEQLKNTPEASLTDGRVLGRKQIPTTVAGLLFHSAEHCMRHIGQLLVTTRILKAQNHS
jgi:hypothetical protein